MKDYYKTLGIDKGASKEDVKKAFRKMAHEYHPDKTKNDPAASAKFKEASEAYSILSDDAKRKQYDTFGQAGAGFNPGAGGFGGQGGFGGAQGFNPNDFAGFDFSQFTRAGGQGGIEFDLGDLFGDFFGGGNARRRPRKGRNVTVDLKISFKESIFGVERELAVGGYKEKFMLKIPAGIETGQGLRIAGKGETGEGGPGDLIVRIWVEEHATFRKEALNLVMDLPVKLTTALGGGTMDIETLDGQIELKIPAGTSHGEILRVKGKGVPYESGGLGHRDKRGDLLVVTHVVMPRKLSKNAQRLIDELKGEGV